MSSSRFSAIDPRTKWGRLYLALVLLRCYSAFFGYGYIHPDEWMQSGEPYYGLTIKGVDTRIPWEWRPDQALRSLSSLRTQYLAAPTLLQFLISSGGISGYKLFLVQRGSVLLWTLFVDAVIASIFPPEIARYLVCLFGISTAATTFSVRPFSNSHEANSIALLLIQVLSFYRDRSWYKWPNTWGWHWGVLPALYTIDGFFMRFTYAIFALPSLLFFAYSYCRVAAEGFVKPALKSFSIAAAAGAVAIYVAIDAETNVYTQAGNKTGLQVATFWGTKWVVPPLNALLYNVKTENVAQHGLHPRWLHALINMPMIIGVANFVVLFIHGWQYVKGKNAEARVKSVATRAASRPRTVASSSSTKPLQQAVDAEVEIDYIDIEPLAVGLSFITIIFSLTILSISPHQEPRFLLALAFPSTVIFAYALRSRYFLLRPTLARCLVVLHILQHVLQLVLFSFLHQGALLRVLFSLDETFSSLPRGADPLSQSQRYQHHLIYRTFPPPLHLVPRKGRDIYPRLDHFDSSTSPEELIQLAAAACDHAWIYTPTWAVTELREQAEVKVRLVAQSWYWHVDMDHLAESLALVRQVGLKEAFAVQKLSVACRRSTPTPTPKPEPAPTPVAASVVSTPTLKFDEL